MAVNRGGQAEQFLILFPIQSGCFLELVSRVKIEDQIMLVAKPFRALMDLVCLREVEWKGIDWLVAVFKVLHHEGVDH